MKQEQLHELFEYKDGNLIWKESRQAAKSGSIAGGNGGYIRICIDYKRYQAHRLIWIYHNGDIPNGLEIDHRNLIKQDNRIENLRLATKYQNLSNRKKSHNNTSGFKGVYWNKPAKKWIAQITKNYKRIHLGCSDTPEGAYELYKQAAAKLHSEFACWE